MSPPRRPPLAEYIRPAPPIPERSPETGLLYPFGYNFKEGCANKPDTANPSNTKPSNPSEHSDDALSAGAGAGPKDEGLDKAGP